MLLLRRPGLREAAPRGEVSVPAPTPVFFSLSRAANQFGGDSSPVEKGGASQDGSPPPLPSP